MTVSWTVSPKWKKSLIERQYFTNGEQSFYVDTCWRGGSFTVYTDDDTPPLLEEGVDIYNCGYDSELIECFDGCSVDYEFEDCDEATAKWLEEFCEENSVFDLEEHGWNIDECEMFITCEIEIEKDE